MKKTLFALAIAGIVLTACAPKPPGSESAQVDKEAARKAAADNFVHMMQGRAQVNTFFDGPGGLIGLVVTNTEGQHNIAWATPDGTHILLGPVVDRDGLNKTGVYAKELALLPGPQTSMRNVDGSISVDAAAIDPLKSLIDASMGEGARELYVLVDPLCPHCRTSYQAMQNAAMLKGLKVHWILTVAVGGSTAEDLIERYRKKELTLEQVMSAGYAETPPRNLTADARNHIDSGIKVLDEVVRQRAVPAVIYKDGENWKAKTGFNPAEYLPRG